MARTVATGTLALARRPSSESAWWRCNVRESVAQRRRAWPELTMPAG